MKFWIHHSLMYDGSFQLLREDDTQIRFYFLGTQIISSKKLTRMEEDFIKDNIINKRKNGFIA